MTDVVVDTHTVVWYLLEDRRISQKAVAAMDSAVESGYTIYIPAICLVEVIYLLERGRLPEEAWTRLEDVLDDPDSPFELVPLSRAVVNAVRAVPRDEVPDMPDRIVAGTAVALRLPLVSRDARIRASQVNTIW